MSTVLSAAQDEAAAGGNASTVRYAVGSGMGVAAGPDGLAAAANVSAWADLVLLVLGLGTHIEHEGLDRQVLGLQPAQLQLLQAVSAAMAPGSKLLLCLVSAGAVDVSAPRADAVLQLFYGGEETGHGLWDVLLGRLSPSARMPLTTYVNEYLGLVGPLANFNMITQGTGRTYRFFNDSAAVAASGGAVSSYLRYKFGYGLSYCPHFTYSGLSVALNSSSGGLQLAVSVAAAAPEPALPAGLSACREVTQVYLTLPAVPGLVTPIYSLVAFASTELQPGGAPTLLSLSISREDLLTTAADGSRSLTGGEYLLQVSGHLPDDELGAAQSNVLRQSISL